MNTKRLATLHLQKLSKMLKKDVLLKKSLIFIKIRYSFIGEIICYSFKVKSLLRDKRDIKYRKRDHFQDRIKKWIVKGFLLHCTLACEKIILMEYIS